jgi:hypothetical protein
MAVDALRVLMMGPWSTIVLSAFSSSGGSSRQCLLVLELPNRPRMLGTSAPRVASVIAPRPRTLGP